MRRTKLFFINGAILTATTLFMRSISLVFNIYVANKVGSATLGIFSLIMSIYMFAITISTSGIGTACTCIVSEEFAKKNYINGFKAMRTCMVFSLLLGVFVSLFIILFAPIVSHFWLNDSVSPKPIYIISLSLPLISISSVIGGYFSSVGKSYKSAISQFLEVSVKIIFTILLLKINLYKGIEAICISLILADVFSEVFSCSLNVIFYYLDKKKYSCAKLKSIKMKKRIFKIAYPVAITSGIKSGLSSLKQFLIPNRLYLSGLTYSVAVSNYGLISGMVMPILMFSNVFIASFSGLLIPDFSRLLAGKNYNRMKSICETIFKSTFVFSIAVSGIFFFFSNELSMLIYDNLDSAKWIKLLSPLIFFMYNDNIMDSILKGINEQVSVMFCNILDLIVTITIIYFVVPYSGMDGYILSIFISEILNFSISAYQLTKRIKYSFSLIKYLFLPIVSCLISYKITNIFSLVFLNLLWNTVFKITFFCILYIVTLILTRKALKMLKNQKKYRLYIIKS